MSRITPLTGSDSSRLLIAAAGFLREGEIHTTDQWRLFMENVLIGPVWHGAVATEADMLALTTTSSRSVFPMDECYRSDTESIWKCIANRGAALSDWFDTKSSAGVSTADVLDGGTPGDAIVDEVDGGAFGDATVDEIDGNDEF